jgi:hypothetical protein
VDQAYQNFIQLVDHVLDRDMANMVWEELVKQAFDLFHSDPDMTSYNLSYYPNMNALPDICVDTEWLTNLQSLATDMIAVPCLNEINRLGLYDDPRNSYLAYYVRRGSVYLIKLMD